MSHSPPYAGLSPDRVLDAIANLGLLPDGRLLALNSFENRVYQIGIENDAPIVAKFYRPQRWNDAAIYEEHAFAHELADAELPLIAPLAFSGQTLHQQAGFRYALYLRRGGRAPALESTEHLNWMGRLIARMHTVGTRSRFVERGNIDLHTFLDMPSRHVLASALLPAHSIPRYRTAIAALRAPLQTAFEQVGAQTLRLHGDCHPGNVLWTEHGPHFVDLDDARMGPAVQDLWMLAQDRHGLDALIEGYSEFRDFNFREISLIEPLRILRQIHWAGWIASRWHDPAFPTAFPYIADPVWWEQHVADLIDAASRME